MTLHLCLDYNFRSAVQKNALTSRNGQTISDIYLQLLNGYDFIILIYIDHNRIESIKGLPKISQVMEVTLYLNIECTAVEKLPASETKGGELEFILSLIFNYFTHIEQNWNTILCNLRFATRSVLKN